MAAKRYSFWSTLFHFSGGFLLVVGIIYYLGQLIGYLGYNKTVQPTVVSGAILLAIGILMARKGMLPRYTYAWCWWSFALTFLLWYLIKLLILGTFIWWFYLK